MKKAKKILLILAIVIIQLAMVFSPKIFATESSDYSITVYGDVANKSFYLFKLFSLDTDGDNYMYYWDETTSYSQEFFTDLGYGTAREASEFLNNYYHNQYELIQLIAPMFEASKAIERKDAAYDATEVEFTNLEQGYYVVFDDTILYGTPRSCLMLKSLNEGINPVHLKSERITITKDISKKTLENGEDATISVLIKSPITIGYTQDNYVFKLSEVLSSELEYVEGSVTTSWSSGDYREPFESIINYNELTKTLNIDMGNHIPEHHGYDILVQYNVKRNYEDANLDNTSTSTLEYSADPHDPSIKEKIENVIVHAYTYRLNFVKKNIFGETLPYAAFKLRMPDGKWAVLDEFGVFKGETENELDATSMHPSNSGDFYISGIRADNGYSLKETQSYQGYSVPNFTFDFDIVQKLDDNGILVNATYDYKTDETNKFAVGFSNDVTVENDTYIPNIDIINVKGFELPSTGGIGTKTFKIIGLSLMIIAIAAIAIIIIKKNKKEE